MFILGPKSSGKTKIAQEVAARSNMNYIDFNEFVSSNGLTGCDDEEICMALNNSLSNEISPRVIIESFPQNNFQAKFFLRNCKTPSNVFVLKCSIDTCQSRMDALGTSHADYIQSGILSQKVKAYHQAAAQLLPYLKEKVPGYAEVNSECIFSTAMDNVKALYEPTIIHIRPGPDTNTLKSDITNNLAEQHGYVNLDINSLIRYETERKTAIGQEMHSMVHGNKIIPAEMIVRMLKKIIFSGQPAIDGKGGLQSKFILTSFPDIIDQAKEFEQQCSKITAIFYTTKSEGEVAIKNNSLSLYNIDSAFQKEFRLRTIKEWNYDVFQEKLGHKINYGVVLGTKYSGKTTLAQYMGNSMGYTVINYDAM